MRVSGVTHSGSRSTSGAGRAGGTSITFGSSIPSFTFSTRLAISALRGHGVSPRLGGGLRATLGG